MNVAYHHPPRTLQFYLKYLLLLVIIVLPSVIIILLWNPSLPWYWTILLLIGFLAIQLLGIAKSLLQNYILLEDIGIPKDIDISSLDLPIPDTFADIVLQLEIEGFERFGEYESAVAGAKHPVPVWIYRSAKGHVLASLIETPAGPFVGFTTFTQNGIVETTYPRGHQIRLAQARFSGVRGSLDAAYRHHINQVRDFIASGERILIVKTVQAYFDLDRRYASQSKIRQLHSIFDGIIGFMFLMIGILPGYLLMTAWMLPGIYRSLFSGNQLYTGGLMLMIGLIVSNTINWRSRGITGPKIKKNTQ
jgi:hypothetical protein